MSLTTACSRDLSHTGSQIFITKEEVMQGNLNITGQLGDV